MSKLIALRGLPGSGKTTLATELLIKHNNSVRLNKDDLREMMHKGLSWSGKREHFIVECQTEILYAAMSEKKVVIIDDTNLNPQHIQRYKEIADTFQYEFEVIDVNTPLDECIARDKQRGINGGRSVGADVIINMAHKYGVVKQEKEFVIFDMDGTIADVTERRALATVGDKGELNFAIWEEPELINLDVPRKDVLDMLNHNIETGYEIVLVSGRHEFLRKATVEWLDKHGIRYNRLIMRPNKDSRPDYVVKKEILDNYLDKKMCVAVVDDRPQVIRMWKEQGLNVIDVGDGVEF